MNEAQVTSADARLYFLPTLRTALPYVLQVSA